MSRVQHYKKEGFSFFVAVAFTVNYIMGTGFLTLPWAFQKAGIVLGVLLLGVMSFVCNIAKVYLLEVMARAEKLAELSEKHNSRAIDFISSSKDGPIQSVPLLADQSENDYFDESGGYISQIQVTDSSHYVNMRKTNNGVIIRDRKFELPELCDIFLGTTGRRIYIAFACVYLYGALWAYSSVFANALSEHLTLKGFSQSESYVIYLAIFGVLMIPLTCLELKEQISVQVSLAICRIIMVVLMVATVLNALLTDDNQFDDDVSRGDVLFRPSNLHILLPIAIYANIFHHSLPALSQPVQDKTRLSSIFGTTIVICWVAYSAIGVLVAYYFGSSINSSSNLNWKDYAGNATAGGYWWSQLISYYVVLFPALDVASAFPLNGITLGNNIMSSWYGQDLSLHENNRKSRIIFRILAAVPPLIGALFVRSLGTITDYAGTSGLIITLVFPALLRNASCKAMIDKGYSEETVYSNRFFNSAIVSWGLAIFGISIFIYVIISLIINAM